MRKAAILPLFLAVTFVLAQPSDAEGWIHLQSSDGIEIFQRYEPDGEVSIQAVAVLEAPLEDLVPFVQKPENFPLWLAEVASSSVLQQLDASSLVHFTLEPASTGIRYDVVAEFAPKHQANQQFIGKLTYRPELSAEKAGFERINAFDGIISMRAVTLADSPATELTLTFTVSFDDSLTKQQTARELKNLLVESMTNLAMKTVSMVIR